MIENKLKKWGLDIANEKIDYQLNDEIGQLVAQYNRTIDELEKSAKLLAQSERKKHENNGAPNSTRNQQPPHANETHHSAIATNKNWQRRIWWIFWKIDGYADWTNRQFIADRRNIFKFRPYPEAHFTKVDVAAKLYSVVQLFKHNNEQVQISFEGESKDITVLADPEQRTQVFNNLLKNAIQSVTSDKAGLIKVRINKTDKEVVIEIEDNGMG